MPVVKKDTCPSSAAARSGSVKALSTASGKTSGTTEHDTTFFPARRIDTMSSTASSGRRLAPAAYTTASASPASIAAGSWVATTPTGATPHSSPASRPALASLCTTRSTSSSCGWSITPRRAITPIEPGPHTPTLYTLFS
nr:hypothetical protein BJP76_22485 [Mycobacterium avium subsp. hominissuis]